MAIGAVTSDQDRLTVRLTQYAHGGGCACKIPPGELEAVVAGLRVDAAMPDAYGRFMVGLDHGDDAAGRGLQSHWERVERIGGFDSGPPPPLHRPGWPCT